MIYDKELKDLLDIYLPNNHGTDMLINAPLFASFCDANKDDISKQTIICMALQFIAEDRNCTIPKQLKDWIERFKDVSLKHLLKK